MIVLNVRHTLDFMSGGYEIEKKIERFAFRSGLRGTGYNNKPVKVKLEFNAENRKQVNDFKRRVERSSMLENAGISINISYEKIL